MEGHELAQDLAVALMHGIQWQLFVAKFVRIVCSRQKATEAFDSRWERGRTTGADTRELLLCVLRHEFGSSIRPAYAFHDNSEHAKHCVFCACHFVCVYVGIGARMKASAGAESWAVQGRLPDRKSVV